MKNSKYWENSWDSYPEKSDTEKTLLLLADYCKIFKSFLCFKTPWSGSIGRFFSCEQNRTHAHEVESAISPWFTASMMKHELLDQYSVQDVLNDLQNNISKLDKNDDLTTLLQVVEKKTKVKIELKDNTSAAWRKSVTA